MVLSFFALVLVTAVGIALLFRTQSELLMSRANLGTKRAFYLAEAAIEDGRRTLFDQNGSGPFADDLDGHAGGNDAFDLDYDALRPQYDSGGAIIGFHGIGDDVPLRSLTALGDGFYAAFLSNDPAEPGGRTVITDTNDRVMVTGVGVGPRGTVELAQAILEPLPFIPALPEAAITLLGPSPTFVSGNSSPSVYSGINCAGTSETWSGEELAATVGAIGSTAEATVESGRNSGPSFTCGSLQDNDTIVDLTDTSEALVDSPPDPIWTDCDALRDMVAELRNRADHLCVGTGCVLPAGTTLDTITFIDNGGGTTNDYRFKISPGDPDGYGLLVVTGKLELAGQRSWTGTILIVGQGIMERSGGGGGIISGSAVVADIAGPDQLYGTADDCTEPPDGFGSASWVVSGGGKGNTNYCSDDVDASNPADTYRVVEFLQR
jgi:hypothetical protein